MTGQTEQHQQLGHNLIDRVCVGDITTRAADLYPQKVAIVDGDRTLTYQELEAQANRLGHALLGLGLTSQEVVGVMSRNSIEVFITYFACAKAGLICAPVNLGLNSQEIAYCLNDSAARVLIVEDVLAEVASDLPAHLPKLEKVYWTGTDGQAHIEKSAGTFDSLLASGKDEPLEVYVGDRDAVQLLYTSGTTSNPKGVLTSHLAVTITAMSNSITNRHSPESTLLVVLPLFHCAALNTAALSGLIVGSKIVLAKAFEPKEVAQQVEQHKVTMLGLLPMMYAALLADPEACSHDFSSVTIAYYGMAPMPEQRLKAVHDLCPNAHVVLGSGQTEFTPATCQIRPEHQWSKAGSWGTATSMTRVAIMDDEGNLLPRGEVGEIVYRGPQLMNGYLNQPEATEESFQYGWFHSGDVAWMDEDGAIWFTDRKKDVIKTGGENVASLEVERCLMEHPDVAESAVIGLPHEYWGEAIAASVILKPGVQLDEEALMAHCREHLAGFKMPKAIVFEEEFPRTGTGKIQKHVLRKQLRNTFENESATS